jgi:hypothetical protein
MKLFALVIDLLGLGLGAFFLIYGIKAGIIEKHILADFFGNFDSGRQAVIRGFFYVAIGCLFIGGSVVTLLAIIAKMR